MKFNSVEISGFRIYDNPEDANFNFVTEDGETADFVSLFAPNGFGKTSFYDAVEWAVTDYVSRFWVKEGNTKKSLKMMRQLTSRQVELFKNHTTKNDTWVKVVNSENKVYKENHLKVAKQRANDASLTSNDEIDFAKVILSQEWISRFLKEADGQARYKKFMESNPGLNKIDTYYQSVLALSKANNKQIASLTEYITEFQKKIVETSEKDLLSTVNAQIEIVNKLELNDAFELIKVTTTQKEIGNLRNKLSEILADDSKIKKLKELVSQIELAQNGTDTMLSRKQYLEANTNVLTVTKKKDNLLLKLSDFQKLEAKNNEIIKSKKSSVEQSELLKNIINLQEITPKYIDILSKIATKNQTKETLKNNLKTSKEKLEQSNRKLIENGEAAKNIEKLRLQLSQNFASIPELKKQIAAQEKRITDLENKSKTLLTQSGKSKVAFTKIEEQVDELLKVIQEFDLGQYSEISLQKDEDHIKSLKQLEILEANGLQLKKQLNDIQLQIDSQETLQKSLNEFIASGLAIVNKQETDTCPLCEQIYDNHTTLAARIMNNDALSTSLKSLLEQRTKKQSQITNNVNSKEEFSDKLKQFYNNKLDELQSQLKIANELIDEHQNLYDKIIKELNIEENALLELKSKFQEESIEDYEKSLNSKIIETQNSKATSDEKLNKEKEVNQKLVSEQNTIQEKLKLLEKEINNLSQDDVFDKVTKWLDENSEETNSVADLIASKVKQYEAKSSEIKLNLQTLKKDKDDLAEKLKTFNEEQLKNDLKEEEKSLQDIISQIETYQNYLKEKLFISIDDNENKDLENILNTKKADAKKELNNHDKFNIEIKKLSGYSENILPHLQSEQAKIDLANFKDELKFVTEKVGILLNEEIVKTRNHLDERIKTFFYEDLINEIYSKIDPHPSFKQVKFIATFEDNNPSLDVYVNGGKSDNDGDSLIPNLYFSTAQINILSLSIFLASALNSKTYDCIFIDDPIQSMDSINVLSTIDLLRSIVVNHKKQIILSTHDENFHNLLKMKIPDKLFKSKFLELEGFGKLKEQS